MIPPNEDSPIIEITSVFSLRFEQMSDSQTGGGGGGTTL